MTLPSLESSDPDRIDMRLLGIAQWQGRDGPPVELWAKDAALVAILALDGAQARSRLQALLWPKASAARAANSLRQRTSRLARAAGAPLFEVGESLRLLPKVRVDVVDMAALPTDVLLNAGELLAGIDLGNHGEIDAWLNDARSRVGEVRAQILGDRAEALESEGRLREALPLARRITEILPMAEHGARRLMRLHYLRGDRGAAQAAYWRLFEQLRDVLGIRPSAETQALLQTIEEAEARLLNAFTPVPVAVRRPPVLIGRESACFAMTETWSREQAFLVLAEGGMGKSRLVEDFANAQTGVFVETALPGDRSEAYAVLGRLLVTLVERCAPVLAPAHAVELARLRPEFGKPPDAPAHDMRIRHAIFQVLVACSKQGLRAIIVDDAQHADTPSLELLLSMGDTPELSALRLGLASRPAWPLDSPLEAWSREAPRIARIELSPWSEAELGQLIDSLNIQSLRSGPLTSRLHRHTGGHPFFVIATLNDLMVSGVTIDHAALPRPVRVDQWLDDRLQRLSEPARQLLAHAAIAGPDLSAERLAEVLQRSLIDLAPAWSELETANVLTAERFAHELVQEAALRTVPRGLRPALHRQWAELLSVESPALASRIAWHWEQGERWSDAGRAWHGLAMAARRAGRLPEQQTLAERSAICHGRAGDTDAEFDVLWSTLAGMQLRQGGRSVLSALPRVEALARHPMQRLKCLLTRTEACLDAGELGQAAIDSERALVEAIGHPELLVAAAVLRAAALAQQARFDEAFATAAMAVEHADVKQAAEEQLRAYDGMHYVCNLKGDLGRAVVWLERQQALADRLGHRVESAEAAGNLAAALAAIGDVPGTYTQARRCKSQFAEIGMEVNSTFQVVNAIVGGAAAAAEGRFDESLDWLQVAVAHAGTGSSPAAHAKARLTLASVWLVLGQPAAALDLVDEIPGTGLGPGMRMQLELVKATALEQAGRLAEPHWLALYQLGLANLDLPLSQSAWFELSFLDKPPMSRAKLCEVRHEMESRGLWGSARGLEWRELEWMLRMPGPVDRDAVIATALKLESHAVSGLTAKAYRPSVLISLSRAFALTSDQTRVRICRDRAVEWIERSLGTVPGGFQQSFIEGNPANRYWLAGAAPGGAAMGPP